MVGEMEAGLMMRRDRADKEGIVWVLESDLVCNFSLPFANCMTLERSLNLQSLSFLTCKVGLVTSVSQG